MARTWEYNVVDFATTDRESIRGELNAADEMGWELLAVALAPKLVDPGLVGIYRKPYEFEASEPPPMVGVGH